MMQNSNGSPNNDETTYTGGGWRSHIILTTLFAIYMFDYADRFVVASMIDFIKRDWMITDAQAGWLMSVILLFITIFSVPTSMLIDRWSRRKMVALMTLFWSLSTLACAFTRNYWQLMIARACIGIGEAGYAPGGTAMLSAAYPESKRGRVMGIWNMAIPLGSGLGMIAGGMIAKHYGWQHAFGVVAIPGMLLAVSAWFLPDYKNIKPEQSAWGAGQGFVANTVRVFSTPSLVLTYLGFAMNVSVTTALMTWLPSYFERVGVAGEGQGGMYATPVMALVIVGAPVGGILADRWHKRSKRSRLIFPAITSALAALTLAVAFSFFKGYPQIGMLVLYGIFVTCFIAPAISVTQEVVHPGLRAFSYAMCVIVQHLAGDIWSPPLIGKLSDSMGLEKAVLFIPAYGFMAALFFLIASFFYERDLEKVQKVELERE